jgi:hypothetical protein
MNLNRALFRTLPIPVIGVAGRGFQTLGLYVVLGAATLSPLLWAAVPPLVDYPNHLARMWILVHRTEIPELARDYVVHWRILPDLAMDFVVPVLATVMPVELAGRVFIGLTMLGLIAGTAVLHRVLHGRFAVWPVWSVLFVYNAVLFWGFLSCLFGIAVYLFVFSGWIATREWQVVPRILVFSAAGALLFLLHLFAFGLYGLSVLSYEAGRRIKGRRLPLKSLASCAVVCLQFVPGLLLWYASLGQVASAYTAYGNLGNKLYALFAPVNFGVFAAPFDRVMWLAVAVFVLLAAKRGALKLAPGMGLPLAALLVTAVLMPYYANGSALADIRLPVTLPFVILASTQFTVSQKWLPRLLGGVALVGFGLRIWTVSESWKDYDRSFNEFRAASAAIAPGARLLIVGADIRESNMIPQDKARLPGLPSVLATVQPVVFWQLGALAVIDRSAFFPYLFTEATPLGVAPRNRAVSGWGMPVTPEDLAKSADPSLAKSFDDLRDMYGQPLYWRDWPRTFDYVLWLDFGATPESRLTQLRPLAAGSVFTIYQIVKQ